MIPNRDFGKGAWMKWALRLTALVVGVAWGAVADASGLTGVAVTAAGTDATIVLTLDGPFDASSLFAMDGPPRLVLDLPGVTTRGRGIDGQGGVAKVRAAQFSAERARVVIDLSAPMVLATATTAPGAITLTLRAADDKAFRALVGKGRSNIPGVVLPGADSLVGVAAVVDKAVPKPVVASPPPVVPPAPKPQPKQPPVAAPDTVKPMARLVTRNRDGKLLVVIDAGHGGHDTGALSVVEGKREKDVVLAIARAIAREIEAGGKLRVLLTRGDDRFIPLPQRVAIARAAKASLFISIHADSAPGTAAHGASIYTLSDVASDAVSARLAARENKSDIIAGVNFGETPDVADILIDLAQRETMNASSVFAETLQRELSDRVPFKTEFHRFAGFAVLKAPDVPSVLLETGYLSSEEDTNRLFSDDGQKAIAQGVRRAVEGFLVRSR